MPYRAVGEPSVVAAVQMCEGARRQQYRTALQRCRRSGLLMPSTGACLLPPLHCRRHIGTAFWVPVQCGKVEPRTSIHPSAPPLHLPTQHKCVPAPRWQPAAPAGPAAGMQPLPVERKERKKEDARRRGLRKRAGRDGQRPGPSRYQQRERGTGGEPIPPLLCAACAPAASWQQLVHT